ncbi:hypothetical protein JST97_12165 [bacterium]|nr:hypothetical protein [bacterium]
MTAFSRRQLLLFFMLSASALAHPGHGPHTHEIEIDAEEAGLLAPDAVALKVKEGRLDASWLSIKPNPARPVQLGQQVEWLVTFDNPSLPDEKKRRLYVFLKLNGQLSGINFTGR